MRAVGFCLAVSTVSVSVAVGMPIARHPPHRPVLARLAHTVLTFDVWRRSLQWGTGAGHGLLEAGRRVALGNVPGSRSASGYVDESGAATNEGHGSGIVPYPARDAGSGYGCGSATNESKRCEL
jgi:hypothetical protein